MFSFDRPEGRSARTPPPTLLFSLHLSKNRCLTQRHKNNRGSPHPSLARRARPRSRPATRSLKNPAADETDLVSVASAVNRHRESFVSFRDVVLGLSQVKTKHSRSQKRCRFCADRATGSKSRSPCWKKPPEEPATPPTIPPNLCRS
jgi:hypothetical protein